MYELLPEESEETVAQAEPEKAAVKAGSNKAPATAEKAAAETAKTAGSQEREVLDKRGVPNAWAVQVASFNTPARADAMRDQLLAKEYPAFTRSASTSQGTLTRVFVGPKISRDQAYRLKSKLDAELKTETLVVTFMP
nr:SPOR domain-containing protein [Pseudomaricurvus sp. HS19]